MRFHCNSTRTRQKITLYVYFLSCYLLHSAVTKWRMRELLKLEEGFMSLVRENPNNYLYEVGKPLVYNSDPSQRIANPDYSADVNIGSST